MNWFEETTEWTQGGVNHTYLMDDSKSKMFAYVKFGQGKPFQFRTPIRLDIRGRKFRIVPDVYNLKLSMPEPEGRVIKVQGCRGDEHTVTELNGNWTCSCSGFRFRGDCRHVKELRR